MGYVFYYVEAHLACLFLLSIILYKIAKGVNKDLSTVYLGDIVFVTMLYFLAEIFWALVDGNVINSTKPLLYLSNIFTYLLVSLDAYLWFILSETLQKGKIVEKDIAKLLISIPVWISGILCISAYRTGLVFYVDENNVLVGGKLYVILIIVPFGYLIASSVKAFYRALDKDRYADRGMYFMIGVFPAMPIILGIMQALYWRVPFVCYGMVAAVFYVYVTQMEGLISLDPLTQINNKNQMYRYLAKKMREEDPGMSLFILLIDIDHFRTVNETYGHLEGDNALVRVADAIKDACQGPRSRFFVSRYGGDEFIVVAEMSYRAEATWLADQIKNNIKRITQNYGTNYDLSVSVGIAQYDYNSPISLQAFIARADSDLYKQKKIN
ncbi:MAG: GGDEF domain-containing protein [Butyrivibrio sp.]|uniref:GGDEF domain-containing protein n=1 Tax=Butyrivibrio sp. TaxID=28121 RepID=UPI001AFE6144|nr:GGDEF domain-containing protein [Butyrivibrio sp.]MBO6242812.1 GGDEF domain-containing protein [Butyrivibrio sp.]